MRIVYFDAGFFLDDPNIRWGDPSYQLEPGDPGYVPWVPPSPSKPPTKKKRMRHNSYYPIRIGDQIIWLTNFANKLPARAAALALAAGTVTGAQADARALVYLLEQWLPYGRAWALGASDAVTDAKTGDPSVLMVLPIFTAPALPAGVVMVNKGALDRLFALVQTIKDSGLMTDEIASDLRIVGTEQTGPDLDTVQPDFKAKLTATGVVLDWGWGGNRAFLDLIELQVDRGTGAGFVALAYDTTPGYTDTHPLPATPTKWIYRGIYRVDDHQVGLWSNPVSVVVGG